MSCWSIKALVFVLKRETMFRKEMKESHEKTTNVYCCLCKNWSADRKSSLRWLNWLMKSSLSEMPWHSSSPLKKKSLGDNSRRSLEGSLSAQKRSWWGCNSVNKDNSSWGLSGLRTLNDDISDRAGCMGKQLLDKHEGFEEQPPCLCQHWIKWSQVTKGMQSLKEGTPPALGSLQQF